MIITSKNDYRTILCIGDAHAVPKVSNRRFDWLGRLILDLQPDTIIDMGDWEDMESLCSYDRGKKSFEGRRIKDDFDISVDASERTFGRIRKYNNTRAKRKKKQYNPEIFRLGGNHTEGRIKRMLEASPEFEGTYGLENLEYGRWNDTYVPFLSPLEIEGIVFSHYFYNKDSRYSPASVTALLKMNLMSCAMGHNHVRGFEEMVRPDNKRMCGLFTGCYLDPDDFNAEYAGPQNKWWSGLVMLHGVKDGYFDPEFLNVNEVKRRYG